jgi:Zn-dependent peptidase ImmA (M78 family)
LPTETEGHDGFSVWPEWSLGGRPIIALTGGHPGDRDRFTLAHECAHLVLHTLRQGIEPKRAEDEANRFAGALLLPKEAAVEAIRHPVTLSVLKGVKATFGISIAMAARRTYDLNLIGRANYVSLMKQLSARGWRRDEPIEVEPERPALIGKIGEAVTGPGSIRERAARAALPIFAIQSLSA